MQPDFNDPGMNETDLQIFEAAEKARAEAAQLDVYAEQVFSKTHPRPQPPVLTDYERVPFDDEGVSFLAEKGVEAAINLAATIGGIAFSAIRTAGIFAIAESRLLGTYAIEGTTQTVISWIAGLSLVTIIEGVLAGFGWVRGKNSGNINTSWTPIVLAGAIAALAGVLPSFELIPESQTKSQIFDAVMWLLVLLSGPGIAYLIYVVTENFGFLHNAWVVDVERRIKEHNQDQDRREREHYARQDMLLEEYRRSDQKWFEALQDDYRKKGRSLLFGQDSYTVRRERNPDGKKPKPESSKEGVQARVAAYLQEHSISPFDVGEGEGFITSPIAIAKAIEVFKDDGVTPNSSPVRTALVRLRNKSKPSEA